MLAPFDYLLALYPYPLALIPVTVESPREVSRLIETEAILESISSNT